MNAMIERNKDALILVARVLLMVLFVLFGWAKLTNFGGTVGYMGSLGAPMPAVSAAIAVAMEFFVAIALILGVFTRPLALVFVLYTFGTALIGHHYWTLDGAERMMNMINFYKNISIMGGLLLLAVTGPGKFAIHRS
ncbi:DoxX family protein [Paraburkholderia sp. BL10I2N1]|uniref:DoxX family protein n=1 Tax=Paraburkholderia sp. BL10I2N1 TaxID=1938796 RepID=UPI00105B9702|nr:DoxX family protein [Paraburkholderia sp. BL10I2N1]TDN62670.1 putative oxidoreductase [Paraburkholderia sp. BL10I2N1]